MSSKQDVMRGIGIAVASASLVAIAVWWWRRDSRDSATATPVIDPHEEIVDEPPADSTVFHPAPLSERQVSARPSDRVRRNVSADDYGAIGVDDLGSAFLARATDSLSDADDEDSEALTDSAGFRIITPRGAD